MGQRQAAEKKGRRAEWITALLLRLKGYKILEKRYKSPFGEVDIIARKGTALIFIEVKARQKREDGHFALSRRQRQRIEKAAMAYAGKIGHQGALRFDLALKGDDHFFIKHLPAAWRAGE